MWSVEGPVPLEAVGPVAMVQLKSSVPTQSNQLQDPASKSQLLAVNKERDGQLFGS